MSSGAPFFIAGGLLLLTWLLNRFVESLLKKELQGWMSESVPLHDQADINAPVTLQPISEAMHEELGSDLLLARISRNNDCVAVVISGLTLVTSTLFFSDTQNLPLLPVIGTVLTFVLGGSVYLVRPKIYMRMCFRGLSIPTAIWAIVNIVVGLLIASGVWTSN